MFVKLWSIITHQATLPAEKKRFSSYLFFPCYFRVFIFLCIIAFGNCYTDRQYILANAAKCLKENQYDGSSDDVTKDVQEQRKKLKEKHLKNLRQRDDVQFAYVAWSVPAKILYKLKDNPVLKAVQ